MEEETLGGKVRSLREARGWSQEQLARKSGLTRGHISVIELRGDTHPRTDVLLKLASAFNIPVEELYQAAGYIREAKVPYNSDKTPEQILEDLKLGIRRLEKKIKEREGGQGEGP